jgi:hypothetical protein
MLSETDWSHHFERIKNMRPIGLIDIQLHMKGKG